MSHPDRPASDPAADISATPSPPPPAPDRGRGAGAGPALLAVTAALVALAVLGAGLLAGTGRYLLDADEPGADGHAAAMPGMIAADGVVDLATVAPAIAAEYRHAADLAEDYGLLPCWCGCEATFDHDSLLDCFVRGDGAWEAHGAGCGVCIASAMVARARLDEGVAVTSIAAELDTAYGPASLPAPTAANHAEDDQP